MDVEAPRPFACRSKGCGMTFTNEDHLNVHEKKHDMSLNLETPNKTGNGFVADQTPTPTRLIKNCEEVGLFDDLKHVNPFDETFRRAVESRNDTPIEMSSISENLNQSEDSLHTPQVFPQFDTIVADTASPANESENCSDFKVEQQQLILSESIDSKRKKASRQPRKSTCKRKSAKILPAINAQMKGLMPSAVSIVPATQIIAFSIPATAITQRPLLLPKTATPDALSPSSQTEMSVKDKLKAHLNSPKILNRPATPPVPLNFNSSSIKRSNNAKIVKISKRESKEIHDDCMERRRAAALRYRRKIKKEQIELRRQNTELMVENNQLKTLVKQLRELLRSHQNCNGNIGNTVSCTTPLQDNHLYPVFVTGEATPIQLSVATPVKLVVQNANINGKIGTILKIPVGNVK